MLRLRDLRLPQPQPCRGTGGRVPLLRAATFFVNAARQPVPGKQSPESANGQPGSVTSPPPAVLVGLPLQSDRPPTSGPIWTGTPDGLRTSTDIVDDRRDIDLTDVKVPQVSSSSVFSTANATIDPTSVTSVIVNATATASYFTPSLVNMSRFFDVPTLNMLPNVITEGEAPNIMVTIHSVVVHMLLDSGAQGSVLPSSLAAEFDPPISLPSVTREVRTFGNHQVTLRGPLTLELQLCGFRTRHQFYFIDVLIPAIGGYDLMQAARLVVDVANRRVWSRRPVSATTGPISPNPESPISNNSVHSCVAMTEPQNAHRAVTPRSTTSSSEELDIKTCPTCLHFSGNSVSLSQATTLALMDRSKAQQHFCVDVSRLEDEDDVTATVAEINQCYQNHVDAFRSRVACCLLPDTDYSDFDESDGDEEWEEYQQDYRKYSQSFEESARADVQIVTDKEESDVEEQRVEVSPSQRPTDVLQLETNMENDSFDLLPFTFRQLELMWDNAPPCRTAQMSSTQSAVMQFRDAQT